MGNVQSRQRYHEVASEALHAARDLHHRIGGPRIDGAILAYLEDRISAEQMMRTCTQLEANEFQRLAEPAYLRWIHQNNHLYRCQPRRDGRCRYPDDNIHNGDCAYFVPLPPDVDVDAQDFFDRMADNGYSGVVPYMEDYSDGEAEYDRFGGRRSGFPEGGRENNMLDQMIDRARRHTEEVFNRNVNQDLRSGLTSARPDGRIRNFTDAQEGAVAANRPRGAPHTADLPAGRRGRSISGIRPEAVADRVDPIESRGGMAARGGRGGMGGMSARGGRGGMGGMPSHGGRGGTSAFRERGEPNDCPECNLCPRHAAVSLGGRGGMGGMISRCGGSRGGPNGRPAPTIRRPDAAGAAGGRGGMGGMFPFEGHGGISSRPTSTIGRPDAAVAAGGRGGMPITHGRSRGGPRGGSNGRTAPTLGRPHTANRKGPEKITYASLLTGNSRGAFRGGRRAPPGTLSATSSPTGRTESPTHSGDRAPEGFAQGVDAPQAAGRRGPDEGLDAPGIGAQGAGRGSGAAADVSDVSFESDSEIDGVVIYTPPPSPHRQPTVEDATEM